MEKENRTIKERVFEIIAEEMGIDEAEVTVNAHLEHDIGADSLDRVELIMRIEEEFEIDISDEEIDSITTVGEAITFIIARKGKS